MPKRYLRGMIKGQQKEDGGYYWNDAGYTLIIDEFNGQPRYSLLDNRTGGYTSFFERRRRDQQGNAQTQGANQNAQSAPAEPPF